MHELALAQDFVDSCGSRAGGRKVLEVWARCPESIDAAELGECFGFISHEMAARGQTWLEGAELHCDVVPVALACSCGFDGDLDSEQLAGRMAVCPQCGRVSEVAAGLELVAICYDTIEPHGSPRSVFRPGSNDQSAL